MPPQLSPDPAPEYPATDSVSGPGPLDPSPQAALARFRAPTRAWFSGAFDAPTSAQVGAWRAIANNHHVLAVAPTGSGKTLAAFLWALDGLLDPTPPEPEPVRRCRVLYISPLKALAADVERNLRSPLAGVRQAAARAGDPVREVLVGTRTGDTPASERRRFATAPPDILITTPESLFLILTSGARSGLTGITTVIIDEIHAVAGTKRGAHLALSLERLDALLEQPAQRIGLSATVAPVDAVAAFLTGARPLVDGGRPVDIVQPPATKRIEVDVVLPVPDLTNLHSAPQLTTPGVEPLGPNEVDLSGPAGGRPARASVWPHVDENVVNLVIDHEATLVFTNSRRGAERLTARMNEIWAARNGAILPEPGELRPALLPGQSGSVVGVEAVLARAHHGSMSRAERTFTETELKEGRLPAVVSTSSLELGIDMGSIDLVVQIGAPPSVASGLQRIGRAGHQVGAVSHGIVLPLHRGDLVPSAVIAQRMRSGQIEAVHTLRNPVDVLAQQVVAMVATEDWSVAELATVVRRAAPFTGLGDKTLRGVLDMLAGRYPSEDFGELRARLIWDRTTDLLSARPGALRLAVTSGGTIPDRGLYGVFLDSSTAAAAGAGPLRGGKRVGELEEEMVHESRVGDTFTLGSSTWRITDITPDRVLVVPAPGIPGRLPFWKGDAPGRPAELGRAIGAWMRAAQRDLLPGADQSTPSDPWVGLDPWAADNLKAYLLDQHAATGVIPTDQTLLVERFRDELGDWRVVIHTPYGAKVHAPWALVLSARIRDRFGIDAAAMHSDDGIVLRLPDVGDLTGAELRGGQPADFDDPGALDLADLLISPDEVLDAVQQGLGESALFGARFREAAARALLLPRRRPDRRQPLWQQRHRAAQLLGVAREFPDFPIVLEAVRECLQDDFDVAALIDLMRGLDTGAVRIVEVTTPTPSPFAQSLLFGYTAQFIYEGDAPLAERRAAALTLDPDLLAELLGQEGQSQIADLLDPAAVLQTEQELTALTTDRQARHGEDVWELLRRLGPLTFDEIVERTRPELRSEVPDWLSRLVGRRIIEIRLVGVEPPLRWAAAEDAGRLRDALGVALPVGLPEAFTEPVGDPLGDLLRRYARTHGPFTAQRVSARFGLGVAVVHEVLHRQVAAGQLATGRLRPDVLGGTSADFCDVEVLRTLRRRSLAALRAEVEPVEQTALGVFLPQWQSVGRLRGVDGLARAVEQLAGAVVPLSALESQILPARVVDYTPAMLDELTTSGEVLWCGHRELPGSRGRADALISLHLAETADLTLPVPQDWGAAPLQVSIMELLAGAGGFFLTQLCTVLAAPAAEVLEALWELVWHGQVTNDGLGPLRARAGLDRRGPASSPPRPRPLGRRPRLSAAAGARVLAAARPTEAAAGGRWSTLPDRDLDPTRRAHTNAAVLLDRHGIVTRAVVAAEEAAGPYSDIYKVFGALETAGQVRRGYFIEHLGGAQFALPGAVDQLRTADADRTREWSRAAPASGLCLAATDPAQPYGAALAWPTTAEVAGSTSHRPGRKAGSQVVLVRGELVLYLERGGRSLLTFCTDSQRLDAAAAALALAISQDRLGKVTVQRIDGIEALTASAPGQAVPVVQSLRAAGFGVTPSGLRLVRTGASRA